MQPLNVKTTGKLLSDVDHLGSGFAVDCENCADAHKPLHAAMICVDFADKRAAELSGDDETNTTAYYKRILRDDGLRVFDAISYGKLKLSIDFYDEWYHMPLNAADYKMARVMSAEDHCNYISEAMLACRADVDFAKYDIFYIAAIKAADEVPYSPTYVGKRYPITNEAGSVGLAVTFGGDMHFRHGKLLAHETGHIMGLPDLYTYDVTDGAGSVFGHCGMWDLMCLIDGDAPDYLGWHKWRLGFIDDGQVALAPDTTEVKLSPVENDDGMKLAVVPVDDYRAYTVEVRRPLGLDEKLKQGGVLISFVNAHIRSGEGCIDVMPRDMKNRLMLNIHKQDELYQPGDVFSDAENNIRIEIISSDAQGDTVKITRAR